MSMMMDDKPPMPALRKVERLAPDAPRRRGFIGTLRPAPASEAGDETDSAARAALDSLRNIVVAPAMQLNEQRLGELVAIMEEREAQFRADLAALEQKLDAAREALETRLTLAEQDFTTRLETSVQALADAAARQAAEIKSELRDGLAEAAQQNRALAGHLDYAANRLEQQMEERVTALNADLAEKSESLSQRIVENRNNVMAELGRAIGGLASAIGKSGEEPAAT